MYNVLKLLQFAFLNIIFVLLLFTNQTEFLLSWHI